MGLLFATVTGCSGEPVTVAAMATFERFQDALFCNDPAAARNLVTSESRPVIDSIPWTQVTSRDRLIPVDATDQRGCYHIAVRDPNEGHGLGFYVVVRERGRLVVDLVATAELAAEPESAGSGPQQLELRELRAEDHDRIRRIQLEGR